MFIIYLYEGFIENMILEMSKNISEEINPLGFFVVVFISFFFVMEQNWL